MAYCAAMADSTPIAFPAHGTAPDELLAELGTSRADDLGWREGRAFSLVYNSGDHEHERLLEAVARSYQHDNALNPFAYPSLLRIELELVAMAADLFGAPADAGAITSGGTESIFLAVQTARDHARAERGIAEPRLVTPITAHPAFAKAAHYLDVEHVLVPVGADGRVDLDALADTVDDRTGLVVASAPNYPYGVIDDVTAVAALAAERDILCHVDACLGGWLLPWWEQLGEPVPPWDLRVPGVTSLSADIHKYGYTFKGASVILYRDRALLKHQHFWYDTWPGGLYASGTTAGTRARRRPSPAPGTPCATWVPTATSASPGRCATPPGASRPASRPSRASASPTRPTSRCSSSRPTTARSAPSATAWPHAAGTSTASRAASTSCSPRSTSRSPTSSSPTSPRPSPRRP